VGEALSFTAVDGDGQHGIHVCGLAVASTNKSLARMNKSLLVLSKKCTL